MSDSATMIPGGGSGANRFLKVLLDILSQHGANAIPLVSRYVDLGTIQTDRSLKLDNFGPAFPVGIYWTLDTLRFADPFAATDTGTLIVSGSAAPHTHQVNRLPSPASRMLDNLLPNDRVVVLLFGQENPIVIGRLRTSI